ncbi:hypothetical protein GCM10022223_47510 [Kineosporia mesophila]|uniref:Uncharacterized protein n=1 Tax=Kineosporia mesophila TaxID=566012 RepID=A0ABP7A4T0_9ACTN
MTSGATGAGACGRAEAPAELAPVPAAVIAATETLYATPLLKPDTTARVPLTGCTTGAPDGVTYVSA